MSVMSAPAASPEPAVGEPLLCDASLPAVRFLTGDDAVNVLRPPVEAAGGELLCATPRSVQYRPGSDLVVKYAAEVMWPGCAAKRETIMAATGVAGVPDGTVPVAALVDGRRLEVGVWRWPFDPVLVGLTAAVTPRTVAELCDLGDPHAVSVEVLAFRPTERAVVRVTSPNETLYLKVVSPSQVDGLVRRHQLACEAGVPAPVVRQVVPELGIVVLDEVAGPLLKNEIKSGAPAWLEPDEFNRLADLFGRIDADLPHVPSRVRHAVLHADMLRAADEANTARLDQLCDAFAGFTDSIEAQTIHGDLHEGQIIVDAGRIIGVLDLDDLGTGSPLEERANLLGFLHYRSITLPDQRGRISDYAQRLRDRSPAHFDRTELDVASAAVLVGLATGPFRIQQPGWQHTVSTLLDHAAGLLPTTTT